MKTEQKPQMGALGQKWPDYTQPQMDDGQQKPVQPGSLPQGRVVEYPTQQMG